MPRALARRASEAVAPAPVEAAVTINRPRAELYAFWRRLEAGEIPTTEGQPAGARSHVNPHNPL